jgi:hypothetical protein
LLQLASRGLLDRIRRCAWSGCQRWFFARFSHKECCSGVHQQKRVRSTEEEKKKRREYMQRFRAGKRQREKKELELAEHEKRELAIYKKRKVGKR